MQDIFKAVHRFTNATYISKGGKLPLNPVVMDYDKALFVTKHVISELREFAKTVCVDDVSFIEQALRESDPPKPEKQNLISSNNETKIAEQADALVDAIYYILDSSARHGYNLGPVFDAVHAANMMKVRPDGTVKIRADGKIEKPEGWKEPDIKVVIRKQLESGSWLD